jgi:hypothetical protein
MDPESALAGTTVGGEIRNGQAMHQPLQLAAVSRSRFLLSILTAGQYLV